MAKAVIDYDKDLPEIPGRRPWEKPASYRCWRVMCLGACIKWSDR